MLLFAMGWGSVFLARQLQDGGRRLGSEADPDVRRLQEAIDDLGTRLAVLEEERDFYRDLIGAPEVRRLRSSADGDDTPAE